MLVKIFKIMGMTALIAGLVILNVAASQAAEGPTAGSSPESAIAPTVGWTTIEPGTTHWYTFNYDYIHENESTSNAPEQAIARLEMANPGSVEFAVQTMDRLGPWLDEDDDPGVVGRGSALYLGKDDDNDSVYSAHELAWAGSARASGDFLISVEGDGGYQLTVDGETVNFTQDSLEGAIAFAGAGSSNMQPEQSAVAMASGAEEILSETFALSIEPATAAILAMAGSGPEYALSPTGGWATIKPGESHWYKFNYDYAHVNESDDNEPAVAIANLEMVNPGSVGFAVQTMERMGPWTDVDDDPGFLGVGSPLYLGRDDDSDSVYSSHELVWAGSARASGSYYIIVEGDGPYRLTVTGETVNFPATTLDTGPAFAMTSN
jgi:hypothetical protein